MNAQINETENLNHEIHGEAFGQKLVIGFTNVYYTLWVVTFFAKVENVRYIQNLSVDFGAAQKKAADMLKPGEELEIDLDLKGDSGFNFFRPLAAKRYAPELLAFSRFAGKDMRTINPNEEYFYAETRYGVEYKKMSGLLWATYLNEDEKTFRGLRRRVIARQMLIKAGILVHTPAGYFTPEQIKKKEIKAMRDMAVNGHHEEDGKRLELTITRVGNVGSFDTQYGITFIFTFIDSNNRLFKYMGSNRLDIEDGQTVEVKATIKHSEYKGVAETKLQRIKIK
jgi:hypothetical protein